MLCRLTLSCPRITQCIQFHSLKMIYFSTNKVLQDSIYISPPFRNSTDGNIRLSLNNGYNLLFRLALYSSVEQIHAQHLDSPNLTSLHPKRVKTLRYIFIKMEVAFILLFNSIQALSFAKDMEAEEEFLHIIPSSISIQLERNEIFLSISGSGYLTVAIDGNRRKNQ